MKQEVKRVNDLYIEEQVIGVGSLNMKCFKGKYENKNKKMEEVVIKQIQLQSTAVITGHFEVNLTYFYQRYFAFSQQVDSPFLVKGISSAKTKTSFYFGFQRCKMNLQQQCTEGKPKFGDEDLLSLLDCASQGLNVLQKAGGFHGNLKLQNILYYQRENGQKFYKLSDYYGFQINLSSEMDVMKKVFQSVCERNRMDSDLKYIQSPEFMESIDNVSINSDIYSLGAIAFILAYKVPPAKRDTVPLRNDFISKPVKILIEKMIIKDLQGRITLNDLLAEIHRIKTSQLVEHERMRYIESKGFDPNVIAAVIKQQITSKKEIPPISFKNEFVQPTTDDVIDKSLQLRARAQFYYIVADIVEAQSPELQSYKMGEVYLNYLIFASHYATLNSFRKALDLLQDESPDNRLKNILQQEVQQYSQYFNKVLMIFDNYVKDLDNAAQQTPQRQDYDKWNKTVSNHLKEFQRETFPQLNILGEAITLIREEIIDKSCVRRVRLNEKATLQGIRAVSLLLILNKLEYCLKQSNETHINYPKIIDYLQKVENLDVVIQS